MKGNAMHNQGLGLRLAMRIAMGLLLLVSIGCVSRGSGSAADAKLSDKETLCEVIGHLYRWHLDEVDVRKATCSDNDAVWVRDLCPELDEGDRSCFSEILLPVAGVLAKMKKADYTIEETGQRVFDDGFKIISVSRTTVPEDLREKWTPVKLTGCELRDYLFAKRGDVDFPDDDLSARLRRRVMGEIEAHFRDKGREMPSGKRVVHCAPLSPVANEIWVFWEAGRLLVHFTSDIDIRNSDLWEHEELTAQIYDIDEQVVVSLQEVPGSNAYLTRDQVGRALYNCIVLGKRYESETASE